MDIDSLVEKADEALENGDDRTAIAAGNRLIELRHVYGFEVLARAYWLRDDKDKAIATLADAVQKAPRVWTLWELLGDYRSDVGDTQGAAVAYDTVVRIAREALAASDLEAEERARLHYSIAYATWSKGDSTNALNEAWQAIALHPSNEDAMWLIREIEGRTSGDASYYRLVVRAPKYEVSYAVVADDEDEATQLVSRFEPESVRASLVFDEITHLSAADGMPKGVYLRDEE